MNEHQKRLMDKPSVTGYFCPFCGRRANNAHHIVPRSQGGTKGPVINVCGFGNAGGCHGLLHMHILHLDWDEEQGCWVWLKTDQPMRDDAARRMDGWKPLRGWDRWTTTQTA